MKKIFWILLPLLIFASCGKTDPPVTPTSEDNTPDQVIETVTETVTNKPNRLLYSQSSESVTLDPHDASDIYSRRVITNLYDRLIETTETLEVIPGVAESWEQVDDLTLKFTLKQGIKFHNGEELTAEDVKFTFERAKTMPRVVTLFEMIDTIETPDPYTVIFKTAQPSGSLIHHLTHISASILNKNFAENNDAINHEPMGTGPYTLEEWRSGSHMLLKRYDDYFRGVAPIEFVEIRVVPEENSRVIAVETGEHHIADDIESIGRGLLEDKAGVRIEEMSSFGVAYLGLNTTKGPLQDVNVRRAIAMGIDRATMIEALIGDHIELANSILGPGVVGHSKETQPVDYNPEEAKRLLAEAGHETLDLTLSISDSAIRRQMSEVIQAQLREVGINIKIEILEWAAFLNYTGNGESDLFMLGWTNSSGDADFGITQMLHSSMAGGAGNRSFFNNSEFDSLLEAGRIELDPEKRNELYARAQDIMNEEVPLFPIYCTLSSSGVRDEVKGFVQSPLRMPRFFNMSF